MKDFYHNLRQLEEWELRPVNQAVTRVFPFVTPAHPESGFWRDAIKKGRPVTLTDHPLYTLLTKKNNGALIS